MMYTNRHIDRLDNVENARIARANNMKIYYKGRVTCEMDLWYNPDPHIKYVIHDTVNGVVPKAIH